MIDFAISSNAKVVIVTIGSHRFKHDSELEILQKNADLLIEIIPALLNLSPDAVFLIVSDPGKCEQIRRKKIC